MCAFVSATQDFENNAYFDSPNAHFNQINQMIIIDHKKFRQLLDH